MDVTPESETTPRRQIIRVESLQTRIRPMGIAAALVIALVTLFAGVTSFEVNHDAALVDNSSRAAAILACRRIDLVPLSYFGHRDRIGVGMLMYEGSHTMPVTVTCGTTHGQVVRDVETTIRL